ncbi:phage portal protein [Nioella sp.]|uniref:phage portal protein n=1 Tax=Nioella sp. TaxID=1912091 RepID=UPI0035175135
MRLLRKMAGLIGGARRLDITHSGTGRDATARAMDAGMSVSATSSMALSAVWGCVGLLAGTISSLPFQVYQSDGGSGRDGKRVMRRDHPLYAILHDSPNADQTALDFWDFMTQAIELWGNAYAKIDRLGGKIVALTPIRPDAVSVRRDAAGALRYRWSDKAQRYDLGEEDVLHIRGPGGDPLGGMSTLTFARATFSLALAENATAAGIYRNGLRPGGLLKFKEWLSPEQRDVASSAMVEQFTGAANAGRPFVAEGGVEWQPLGINPVDAQMLETRGFSIEEICRFFSVPPVMVQHSSATTSWPTGVEQQVLLFQKFTLRRRLKRIEQAVSKQLLTPAERAAGLSVEFNLEGLLRGDSAGRASFYNAGLNGGWLVINEVRAWENLPPVEGGEIPRVQKQNVPITELERLIHGS